MGVAHSLLHFTPAVPRRPAAPSRSPPVAAADRACDLPMEVVKQIQELPVYYLVGGGAVLLWLTLVAITMLSGAINKAPAGKSKRGKAAATPKRARKKSPLQSPTPSRRSTRKRKAVSNFDPSNH